MLTDDHGEWDVGNIGLFVLIGLVLGAIPIVCAMLIARAVLFACCKIEFPFDVQSFGIGVGAICTGYASAVGAWGVARRMADNKAAFQPPGTTTETSHVVDATTTKVSPVEVRVPDQPGEAGA